MNGSIVRPPPVTASGHAGCRASALLQGAMVTTALLLMALPLLERPSLAGPGESGSLVATTQNERPALGEAKQPPDATRTRYLRQWEGPRASRMFGEPEALPSVVGWILMGVLPVLAIPACFWILTRPRRVHAIKEPGFEVISLSERRRLIPLKEKFQYLDFVAEIKMDSPLRLSANLNKVSLSMRRFGYLLEDKNFRNALLVNRRRVRRTLLKNGDVLDLGDLTLLYRDLRTSGVPRYSPVTPQDGKALIKFKRARGPIRRGTPILTSEQYPNRVFYMTKNMIYIGRSEDNDLVVKSASVHYRHAKIERVGGRYKLLDLGVAGNTFVNNRRVEQRYLKDGDVITIDRQRFKFTIASKSIRERPTAPEAAYVASEEEVLANTEGEETPGP